MKNYFRKLFAPLAIFAMALGLSMSTGAKQPVVGANATVEYTGFEGFENTTNLTASYLANSFTNADDITFSYNKSRNEDVYGITTKGLMFAGDVAAYLQFTLPNGLAGLKFQYRKAFTGTGNRQLGIYVNGNSVGLTPTFGSASGALATIFDYVYEPASPYVGETIVKIAANLAKQVTIDNIQWANAVVDDVVTALSVNPTSKSYFTTDTLLVTDFAVSITKNGGAGTSDDYTAKIGSGTGAGFTGVDIVWGETKPTTSNTAIQFKSKYPETSGGETYKTVDVVLTVTAPSLSSITISGSLNKTSYLTTGSWDPTGLSVTANYNNSATEDITGSVTWSYDPATPNSTSITSVSITATYDGKTDTISKTVSVSQKTSTVIISEMYGNGGNSGATLNSDYIELYNTTSAPVSVNGWTVQYGSATGSSWSMSSTLTGTIAANSFYLVSLQASPGSSGSSIPTADETVSGITAGGTNFKIALVKSNNNLGSVANPSASSYVSDLVDFLGAGTANAYEGDGASAAGSATTSVSRITLSDSDDNSTDFEAVAPSPMNSALSVAEKIMAYESGDKVTAECEAKYDYIKPLITGLTAGQLGYFQSGTETLMVNARNRYVAWAIANGDSANQYSQVFIDENKPTTSSVEGVNGILLIVLIGLTSVSGYYLFKKKNSIA